LAAFYSQVLIKLKERANTSGENISQRKNFPNNFLAAQKHKSKIETDRRNLVAHLIATHSTSRCSCHKLSPFLVLDENFSTTTIEEAAMDGKAMLAMLIVAGVLIYQLYLNISEIIGKGGFWLSLMGILAIPVALYVYFIHIQPELRFNKRLRKAPKTGPMKVNIRTEKLYQGFRLHIDVQLCQKDMLAMKNSGMELHELFPYPHPEFPDKLISYRNVHLYEVKYVDFPDIQALDKGKDELMMGLHFLRSRFDQTTELLQEQEHAPKTTTETYEI
jgi:hypothetical protein